MATKELITKIVLEGTREERLALYSFDIKDDNNLISKKFRVWARANYPRYFDHAESPDHKVMVENYVKSYKGECNGIEIAFRGFGKRQPLDAKLMTPKGYKTMGELKVGDNVIGSDGKPVEIEYMSSIVERPVYKITTEDGRSTECDIEHLWTVRKMSNVKNKHVTVDLKHIIDSGLYYNRIDKRNGKKYKQYKFAIETVKPVQLEKRNQILNPYILGAFLGNGSTSRGTMHFHAQDEKHFVNEFGDENISDVKQEHSQYGKNFTVYGISDKLKQLGLKVSTYEKFIPDDYLYGDIQQRKAVLEGLMDTDGHCQNNGQAEFTSSSKKLAEGVVSLVRSLGGRANLSTKEKPTYSYGGEKLTGQPSYRVSMFFTNYKPFRLQRKYDCAVFAKKTYATIVDIQEVGVKKGRCIKIKKEDGLYVTDDYILTHNTSILKLFIAFCILNDNDSFRKYIKIMSRDLKNSKQMVTDIYNLIIEVKDLYGDIFEKEGDKKREETMGSFTTKKAQKLTAGTVGVTQRGHLQDAYRPDYCHKKDTMVFVDGDWIKVQDHKSYRGDRKEKGKMVKLNTLPFEETVTDEHKYMVRSFEKKNNKNDWVYGGWKEAQDLDKKDFIGLPIDYGVIEIPAFLRTSYLIKRDSKGKILKSTSIKENVILPEAQEKDFWWLVGLWWGDGTLASKKEGNDNSSTISIVVADTQKEIFDRVVYVIEHTLKRKYFVNKSKGCSHISFSHAVLARFLRGWYTGGNSQKRPVAWVEKIDFELQKELTKGYISADGFVDHNSNCVRVASVSLNGLLSLRRILARLDIPASIRINNYAGESVICGVKCNTQNKYDLRIKENAQLLGYEIENQSRYKFVKTFIDDGYLWSKVFSISDSGEELFCPIMTTDHQYQTHFGLSHNCIFEDIEDRESVSSIVITEGIIQKCDEAISGLSFNGSYQVNANYISDVGSIQWFLNKPNINSHIVPILKGSTPTWDRYTPDKIEQLKAEAEDWSGEYLCDPSRVGDKFFDIDRVEADLKNIKEPIKLSAGIRYWDDFKSNHRYGMGVDLSDGIGKDSCALSVFDFTSGELIVSYDNNQTAPDLFTYEAVRVGQEYGNCIIAPETNNTCGGISVRVLKEKNYPNIYTKEIIDKIGNTTTKTIGWHTNSRTKPDMFYEFRKDYNDGLVKIYDERVLKEMKAFTKADLKDARTSAITRHFDLLISVIIAWQMKDKANYAHSTRDFYENLKNKGKSNGARQ